MSRICIYIFLYLGTILNSYGQSISGKVVYKIQPIDFELKSQSAKINSLTEKMYEAANKQSFMLEFNTMESSFVLNNFLEATNIDDQYKKNINNLASMLVTSDFNYYLNLNTNIVILEKKEGILIQKKYEKKNWEITTETKTIGDYLCYRAVNIKKYIGRNGKNISIPVIAWFAPSLPYGYGPKDYNGLPGLILELQERKTIYYATLISLVKDKKEKIDFPKGKTISEEEYTKKVIAIK